MLGIIYLTPDYESPTFRRYHFIGKTAHRFSFQSEIIKQAKLHSLHRMEFAELEKQNTLSSCL